MGECRTAQKTTKNDCAFSRFFSRPAMFTFPYIRNRCAGGFRLERHWGQPSHLFRSGLRFFSEDVDILLLGLGRPDGRSGESCRVDLEDPLFSFPD
ncbi:unnamed protein product [Amoebophrya sp. A25]|nr:unnamed protein product [Amoebophrya sp. A25]|eukprot:GSA25T00026553001.1